MIKEVVYREEQVNQLARRLNLTKTMVADILNGYVGYLKDKLSKGETIKFLNVCYLRVDGKDEETHETLAYVSNELGKDLGISQSIVYRVLTTFEEYLISDLKNFYSYCIKGLFRIRLERYGNGYKVRTKKSTVYDGLNVTVTTLGSFKRKAEIV